MTSALADALGISVPVLAAPMAGGPTTPELVQAAARAGGLGFLAAGYKSPEDLAAQIASVQGPFGVNLFAPNPVQIEPPTYLRYAERISVEAERYHVAIDLVPLQDDDNWHGKLDVLREHPVQVISFTFGMPGAEDLAVLRGTGAYLIQTVTTVDEARAAVEAGMDALVVQASAAGGHSGVFDPHVPSVEVPLGELIVSIRDAVDRPIIAAGGIASPEAVAAAIVAGADAVAVGTVLLRSNEAGTSAVHRAALADPARQETVVTHAFTGRPARGLRNEFTDAYSALAPYGYPALHHLTSPIRKAAAAAGDAERVHLWAGTGYRSATEEPAADIMARLASAL